MMVPPPLQVVERRSSELRRDFTNTADLLVADLARLAKDGAALRTDVCSIAASLKRSEADVAALGSRLARLESSEASNPKASVRLVSALEDKMESLAAQQVCATAPCGANFAECTNFKACS